MRFYIWPGRSGITAFLGRIVVILGSKILAWSLRLTETTVLYPAVLKVQRRIKSAVGIVGGPRDERILAHARQTLSAVPRNDQSKTKVLVVAQRAWEEHTALQSTVAAGLALRRANVSILSCGGGLPICEMGQPEDASSPLCRYCSGFQNEFFKSLDLPHLSQADLLSIDDRLQAKMAANASHDCRTFVYNGVEVGKLVGISLAWVLRDSRIADTPKDVALYRELITSGAMMAVAAQRVLDNVKPDVVFALNGLFMEERIICEEARRRGIRVVTYEAGLSKDTWFFTGGEDPACLYNLDNEWAESRLRPLTVHQANELDTILSGRQAGLGVAGIGSSMAFPSRRIERSKLAESLGLQSSDRLITLFTNLDWDTGALERGTAFGDQIEFFAAVFESVRRQPNTRLVVRVHPSEASFPSRNPTQMLLRDMPNAPKDLKLIPPDSQLNSYALAAASDLNIVWTSTIGLELAVRGLPVIVGGKTHYSGKGFTWDVTEPDQLETWVQQTPVMTTEMIEMAQRYAHLLFCRALIPFPLIRMSDRGVRLAFSDIQELQEGNNAYLDRICSGILRDTSLLREPLASDDEQQAGERA